MADISRSILQLHIRPLEPGDMAEVDAVHAMISAAVQTDHTQFISRESLRTVGNPKQETAVALLADGTVGGFIWWDAGAKNCPIEGWVHPELRRRGIGTALLTEAERQARLRGAERLSGRSYIDIVGALPLFQACGFADLRHFYQMWVDLDSAQLEVIPSAGKPLDENVAVRSFHPDDAQQLFEADSEAFLTHWGSEPITFAAWRRRHLDDENVNTDLWALVWLDDEIVAFTMCRPAEFGDPRDGWVAHLGVRSAYRGRGLGRLALTAGLRRLKEAGFVHAGLHCDSGNTAAVKLYNSIGMRPLRERAHVAKML